MSLVARVDESRGGGTVSGYATKGDGSERSA